MAVELPDKPWAPGNTFKTERGLTYTFDGLRWLSDGQVVVGGGGGSVGDGGGYDDTQIKNDLAQEVQDREDGDLALDAKITKEATDRAAADKTLDDKIDKEISDRGKGDSALESKKVNKSGDTITGDLSMQPGETKRFLSLKSQVPRKSSDGTVDPSGAWGVTVDLDSMNSGKNRFRVSNRLGEIMEVWGGGGPQVHVGPVTDPDDANKKKRVPLILSPGDPKDQDEATSKEYVDQRDAEVQSEIDQLAAHDHDNDYAEKNHSHDTSHTHNEYVKQDGSTTMSGTLVVSKSNNIVFEGQQNGTTNVKIWADGTIEQIPHRSNNNDQEFITRRNLNNALTHHKPALRFAGLGEQEYTVYRSAVDIPENTPWFMPTASASGVTSNDWPGNMTHLRIWFDDAQHKLEATGQGMVVIKLGNTIIWDGVVTGEPERIIGNGTTLKEAWSLPVHKISAKQDKWDYGLAHLVLLSGCFWE